MIMEDAELTVEEWEEAESAFRIFAFQTYYAASFKNQKDPTVRFARAITASARPIPDRQAVIRWWIAERRSGRRDADARATELDRIATETRRRRATAC